MTECLPNDIAMRGWGMEERTSTRGSSFASTLHLESWDTSSLVISARQIGQFTMEGSFSLRNSRNACGKPAHSQPSSFVASTLAQTAIVLTRCAPYRRHRLEAKEGTKPCTPPQSFIPFSTSFMHRRECSLCLPLYLLAEAKRGALGARCLAFVRSSTSYSHQPRKQFLLPAVIVEKSLLGTYAVRGVQWWRPLRVEAVEAGGELHVQPLPLGRTVHHGLQTEAAVAIRFVHGGQLILCLLRTTCTPHFHLLISPLCCRGAEPKHADVTFVKLKDLGGDGRRDKGVIPACLTILCGLWSVVVPELLFLLRLFCVPSMGR